MRQHGTVHQHNDERLNRNCREEDRVDNKYRQHRPELPKFLEGFEDMCEGYLGQIDAAKHCIEQDRNDALHVYSAL